MKDDSFLVLNIMYKNLFSDKKDIYPYEWYNVHEYELKKQILRECIKNQILIVDSSLYYNFRLIALND